MTSPDPVDPEARSVGVIAALIVFVFLVLLAVFLYISRLSPDGSRNGEPGASPGAAGVRARAWATSVAAPAPSRIAPGPLPTAPGEGTPLVRYQDARYGFRMDLRDSWRPADAATTEPAFPDADYNVVFEDPDTGARLAVSVWDDGTVVDVPLWVPAVAPGMRPVGDEWVPRDTVAGEPTLAMWSAQSPTLPARYAAFLTHDGRRYRVAYSAADGGARIGEFVRALVSLEFGDDDTPDLVAPLPQPTPRQVTAPAGTPAGTP
jgi:hypothetical protein